MHASSSSSLAVDTAISQLTYTLNKQKGATGSKGEKGKL